MSEQTGDRSLPPPCGMGCTAGERLPARSEAAQERPHSPVFSAFRGAPCQEAFRADRGGHIFLLAGLLLVMGTVTLGGVFVTMNAQEDGIQREQGQNIMVTVSKLAAGFNESIREMVQVGDTNVTRFEHQVDDLEERVHVQAAKDGIYMSLALVETPDPSTWQRGSRCLSYDADRSSGGVVIGTDVASHQESIVGAVFDLYATDGRQVVAFPYYVKIYDCLPTSMKSWFTGIWVVDGFVLNPGNAKSADDNNAVMTIGELPRGNVTIRENLTYADGTLAQNGWENERYFEENDTRASHHPATPLSDYLSFKVDTTGTPDEATITNVQIRADVWHVDVTDDYLQARAIYNSTALYTWAVPTNETEQRVDLDMPLSPSGLPYWTKDEINDTTIEFQVIEVDSFDPPAFFYVEYVEIFYEYTAPEKYAFEATLDWPMIPDAYDRHFLEMRYQYEESTPGEVFQLQIKSNGTWETRAELVPTAGSWGVISYEVTPWEIESGIIEMRLKDSIDDDRWSQDADTIDFDYIYLWSEISGS